jgi:hypothetical protein
MKAVRWLVKGRAPLGGTRESNAAIRTLSATEMKTIRAALASAVDFDPDYFMFAPGKDYNDGNLRLDTQRKEIAIRLISELDSVLQKNS